MTSPVQPQRDHVEAPYFSVEELLEIEADARNGLLALADPAHYLGLLIDVSRAFRQYQIDDLEHRLHS